MTRFASSTLDNQRAGHADSALVDVHKPDASSYSNPRSRLMACSSPLTRWRTQFLIYSPMQRDSLTASFHAMLGDLPQRFPKLRVKQLLSLK